MKLSILSGSFNRFSIDKQFEMVKNIGFDGIELSGTRPHAYAFDMDQRRIDHILELKEKYQLEIPMYGPELLQYQYNISTPYEAERTDTIKYLLASIDAAKASAPRGCRSHAATPGMRSPARKACATSSRC